MKVCILVAGLPPERIGGAEVQASRLAEHLAERHDVLVLTRSRAVPEELRGRTRCEVVRRCPVTVPVLRFGADILWTLAILARRRKTIDVVIAYQTVIDGLIGILARALLGVPVLVAVRSELEYQFGRDLKTRLLNPLVFRYADSIAVQSALMRDQMLASMERAGWQALSARVARKVCIFPNGIREVREEPVAGNIVLCVARLAKVKGVRYLVEAMRDCPEEMLMVVGDGPEMGNLRRLANGAHNVSFVGQVEPEAIDRYIRMAKVLVVPSLNEGFPNVILEAMSRGVPVIATTGGAIPELVKPGQTGFLTAPGDAGAIAECIKTIAADDVLRRRLGVNCLEEIRRYCWPDILRALEGEFRRLVSEHAAHRVA
jgi:glycosyltransferase involved in cell wall biosynthesis